MSELSCKIFDDNIYFSDSTDCNIFKCEIEMIKQALPLRQQYYSLRLVNKRRQYLKKNCKHANAKISEA